LEQNIKSIEGNERNERREEYKLLIAGLINEIQAEEYSTLKLRDLPPIFVSHFSRMHCQ
jgi:hypothetical protein